MGKIKTLMTLMNDFRVLSVFHLLFFVICYSIQLQISLPIDIKKLLTLNFYPETCSGLTFNCFFLCCNVHLPQKS